MNIQNIATEGAVPGNAAVALPPALAVAPPSASAYPRIASTIAAEVVAGFRDWPVWVVLGWDDIRQRYRRSVLGPFWITLSMGFFIFLLGIIYGRLFHVELDTYMPYLSVGLILWGFISTATNESCMAFHESNAIIKQIKLPYSVYILRVVWRNFIVFLHTVVILIPVAIFFKVEPTLVALYALPGLFLVWLNQIWVAMVLAILSTRYRDLLPIVNTAVQIAMFATPIMWPVSTLNGDTLIADINPIYHVVELVRAPLLGSPPATLSWLVAGGMAIVGCTAATALLVRTARRIVFWL